VTNVMIHGIPYMALVYWYRLQKRGESPRLGLKQAVLPLAMVWALAFTEEMFWDRTVWHERDWLFGPSFQMPQGLETLIVPLLAVPQVTHYILDGFIWKRKASPKLDNPLR
jgi:hypothetical protein